tara:strand:+ start:379 stop:1995 length:1617 start_codon:yes stop_codon:yes gene_type:complete
MATATAKKLDNEMAESYSRSKTRRTNWQTNWEAVRKHLRPNVPSFQGGNTRQGERGSQLTESIYDSTAPWALEQLASGLYSHMTDPTSRWFSLGVRGMAFEDMPYELRLWLEQVADRMYQEFSNPATRFQQTLKEVFLDLCSFGTGIQYGNWDRNLKAMNFRSYALSTVNIDEGYNGMVDTVYRDFDMTKRQLLQEFPGVSFTDQIDKAPDEKEYVVTHAVRPNSDFAGSLKKAFKSVHFIDEQKLVLAEGGYDVFPYQVPRWTTMSGEVYGRGPGLTALPDIRLLNVMYKEIIQAAQLNNRPPLVLDDDGFMLPISYQPGSLIFRTPGSADPMPLNTGGDFGITLDMMNQKRDQIAKAFHVDWLLRDKKKERQSVHEVTDDRSEMLKQLSSVTGRLESDHFSPTIKNTFFHLARNKQLPPKPEGLPNLALEITYTSPAAKAQLASKADNITRYLADVAPLRAIDPTITEGLNMPALGQEFAILRDVTNRVMLSPQAMAAAKKKREEDEQAAVQSEQAGQLGSALKDVAGAQSLGLGV